MNSIITKVVLVICIQIFLIDSIFCQENLFNPANDTTTSTGTFYDRIIKSNKTSDYLLHFLSVQLKTNLMTDSLYINNFRNFLTLNNSKLSNPEIDRFGLVTVRLSDTSDAINYIDVFYNSNLFEYVYPSVYGN